MNDQATILQALIVLYSIKFTHSIHTFLILTRVTDMVETLNIGFQMLQMYHTTVSKS